MEQEKKWRSCDATGLRHRTPGYPCASSRDMIPIYFGHLDNTDKDRRSAATLERSMGTARSRGEVLIVHWTRWGGQTFLSLPEITTLDVSKANSAVVELEAPRICTS